MNAGRIGFLALVAVFSSDTTPTIVVKRKVVVQAISARFTPQAMPVRTP